MEGKVIKYGDNVNTDVIMPARHCTSYREEELAAHTFEDLDPTFVDRVEKGDIVLAGKNFGCGSSREHAPTGIKGNGVACVIAESFARIFYRNAINIGLPILVCPEAVKNTEEGDKLSLDFDTGVIENLTRGGKWSASPFPEVIQEIFKLGGLAGYVRNRLGITG